MSTKTIVYTEAQQRFIDEIIGPALVGAVDEDLVIVTYDLNGKIIHATNAFARLFNYYDWHDVLGKTIFDIKILKNDKLATKLDLLRRRVIKQEKTIYSIVFANYSYGFDAHAVYSFPLFMPDGSVVATRAVTKKFTLFNPVTLFNKFTAKKPILRKKKPRLSIELSELEYNILFVISIRFTQDEAAFFLGISRSRLAKILTSLYAKFGISNQDELIVFVKENKLITTIPDEFVQPKVIILSSAHNDVFKKSGVKYAN